MKIDILFNKIEKKMIDSHCHLDHEPLLSNIKSVIQGLKKLELKNYLRFQPLLKAFKES